MSTQRVAIKRLKTYVLKLPKKSQLREIILTEEDELEIIEFLAKMNIWLKLFRMEFS